jgi:uncharacterized protein YjbI with pentapeptide repeats
MIVQPEGEPPIIESQSGEKKTKCDYYDEWDNNVRKKCAHELMSSTNGTKVQYCIFHDRDYVSDKKNADYIAKQFMKLVVEDNKKGKSDNPTLYRGFYLPQINFERFEFETEVDFKGAHFNKANFIDAKFKKKVDFDSADFLEEAEFTRTEFEGNAVFQSVSFVKGMDFRDAKFKKGADFHLAHASDKAAFDSATFSQEANFNTTTFLKSVNFHFTKFEKGVNFSHSRFINEAKFIQAHFIRKQGKDESALKFASFLEGVKADFEHCTFSEYVDFDNATFPANTTFRNSVFKLDTTFSKANFGVVELENVFVCSRADFTASTFLGFADFSTAKFLTADFTSTSFGLKTDFIMAQFKNVKFSHAYFSGQATFYDTMLGYKPDFNDVLFENAQKVLFSVESLHASYFINTNVTLVRFSEKVVWKPEEWEEESRPPPEKLDLEALKAVYRNLRENYENSFRFLDAQRYHIKELDLRREYRQQEKEILKSEYRKPGKDILHVDKPKPKKNDKIRKNVSLTGLYYHISRYGYDYNRAIIYAVIIFATPMISSIIYESFILHVGKQSDLGVAATNYIKAFLQIEKTNILGVIMGIIAIPIWGGLILVALKRTFDIKRKS